MIPVADAIDADTLRIRHEFLTLPGLRASTSSCAHLLGLSPRHAANILESLVREGFLEHAGNGEFVRLTAHPLRS